MAKKSKTVVKKAASTKAGPIVYRGIKIIPIQGKRSAMSKKIRAALLKMRDADRADKAA